MDYQNSLAEQDQTLKDFRKGLSNVMIATDIVQEGLDVPECSFVIRYEFVSNEIGTIQSRGRARAENSSCFLIVDKGNEGFAKRLSREKICLDSKNSEKEWTNRMRVEEMKEALDKWKEIPVEQRRENIRKIQVDSTGRIIAIEQLLFNFRKV